MMELLDFFSFRIAIATLTSVTTIQTFYRGRRPRSPLAQQRRRQNDQHHLYYLNNFLRMATEGRVSPVRSQCQSDVLTTSSRTKRYYRKKAGQAIEAVLESIALETPPGSTSKLCSGTLVYKRPKV